MLALLSELVIMYVLVVDAAHNMLRMDSRADVLLENSVLASSFINALFGVLYEVYSSSVSYTPTPCNSVYDRIVC